MLWEPSHWFCFVVVDRGWCEARNSGPELVFTLTQSCAPVVLGERRDARWCWLTFEQAVSPPWFVSACAGSYYLADATGGTWIWKCVSLKTYLVSGETFSSPRFQAKTHGLRCAPCPECCQLTGLSPWQGKGGDFESPAPQLSGSRTSSLRAGLGLAPLPLLVRPPLQGSLFKGLGHLKRCLLFLKQCFSGLV